LGHFFVRVADQRQGCADRDDLAFAEIKLQDRAVYRRLHLRIDFFGRHFEDGLAGLDGVAGLDQPAIDGHILHVFQYIRKLDFSGH
jgi:hypothetical protein